MHTGFIRPEKFPYFYGYDSTVPVAQFNLTMRVTTLLSFIFLVLLLQTSCGKKDPVTTPANLQIKLRFDPNQARLNSIGQPAGIPAGHAAQTPNFKATSVHYIELAPNAFTLLGKGPILYKAPETTKGGANAIDFDQAKVAGDQEVFLTLPLNTVPPGTYEWIRASVAYQNYEVAYNLKNLPVVGSLNSQKGVIASFVGFNTFITSVKPYSKTLNVNANKAQGFWAFETELTAPFDAYNQISSGQAPAGATTVVNPLFNSSPIPAGSCVVTGKFTSPLIITGKETSDLTITLSFSVNKSFEWIDDNGNGELDFYGDGVTPSEQVVDMGLRGVIPDWK
jgi:hypothetical protein